LDSIIFSWEVISSHGEIERKPDRPREITMEEKMGVIFHSTAGGAVFVDVS
jgi:hypothetical protein